MYALGTLTHKSLMSKRIKVAVIGLGRIGWDFHCPSINRNKKFEFVAVSDPVESRLAEAEALYSVHTYLSAEDLFKCEKLDLVVIASPTHVHKEQTLLALRYGVHVISEKPMSVNVQEAKAMVVASKRMGKLLTVYQPHRYADYFQHLKKIISEGKLGSIVKIKRGMFQYAQRDDWQSLRKYGGGMLNNYGAHALDQLLDLSGRDVKRIFCQLRKVISLGDADDMVSAVYETKEGMLAELDINMASTIEPFSIEIIGKFGTLQYDESKRCFHLRYVKGGKLPVKKLQSSLASLNRTYPSDKIQFIDKKIPVSSRYEIDFYQHIADVILKKVSPVVKPEETLALMKLIDQCHVNSERVLQTV